MKTAWIIIVVLAGACLPLQTGLNARLAKSIGNLLYASFISFIVGSMALGLYMVFTKQSANFTEVKVIPAYAWLGGIFGAFYVTAVILAFPRLGAPLTFGLVVGGQMIATLLLDHFKLLVPHQHSMNLWRLIAIAAIITGVIIIRKF